MDGMIGQTAALKDQNLFYSLSLCDTSSQVPPETRGAWEERIANAQAGGKETLLDGTMERWFAADFMENESEKCDKVRDMISNTKVSGFCGCCSAI
jgi:3-oxoadipate enol-lactonase